VHFELNPTTTAHYGGQQQSVLPITLTRTPLAGFTGQEKTRMAEGEEPVIKMWLSPIHHWLPLRIEGTAAKGTAIGKLQKICRDWQSCATAAEISKSANAL
jgi:hypothetical protein